MIENCTIFTSFEFPQYQKKVLEILSSFEWADNAIKGDYISKIREEIKGKESGLALKFCAFIVEEAKTVGKEQALQLSLPFNEIDALSNNKVFLFENMPTIKTQNVVNAADPQAEA